MLWPLVGVISAIAVTTAMDANGLALFSALALFPLMGLFWYLQRFSRGDIGFRKGRGEHYRLALLYPLIILSIAAVIALIGGAVDPAGTNWGKAVLNLVLMTISTCLVAIVTEEGFFRGWLWASGARAGLSPVGLLVWSSIAFSLWHISAVALDTGFELPRAQIPVYLVNAAILGIIWGLMRLISGSILVPSLSHGVWNGIAYTFFGFGPEGGALGIEQTAVYSPEVGFVGVILNAGFAFYLWRHAGLRRGAGAPTP